MDHTPSDGAKSKAPFPVSHRILPFHFEGSALRVIDRNGEPWFVLADACRICEVGNPSDVAKRLDDDEKDTLDSIEGIHQGPGNPRVSIINESGLYSIMLTSRKPAAKRLRKWVTSEILPQIRKTGGYGLPADLVEMIRRSDGICRMLSGKVTGIEKVLDGVVATTEALAARMVDLHRQITALGAPGPDLVITRDHVTTFEVVSRMAGIPGDRRYRGLTSWAARELQRFCARGGVPVKLIPTYPGERWAFTRDAASRWLEGGGRDQLLARVNERVARKAGQGVLPFGRPRTRA